MVEFVGNEGILLVKKRFEKPAVRVETGGVEDRVIGAHETGNRLFEFLVQALGPADEPHGGEAVSQFAFPRSQPR
jgi:hypothetical protein